MKKLIALLLALTLALALAVPASAAGEDIGIIGGADGPTYILVSADPKAAATVSKEQREQNIKALGGVVGQVNVLLGDRCIAFTDAVPEVKNGRTMVPLRASLEAMGARIEFDQATKTAIVTGEKASFTHVVGSDVITRADGSTVKMDVRSYVTPSNRTMVPVRFFSQVLGYDVFWDNGYRMAFLLDEETFAEKVDSRLTILNGYLAGNAKRFDASKNYKEDVTLSGTVKVIDSIKGDRSYPYSGKASVLLGKDGMSMSLSADLSDLAELLEGLGGKLPEAYRALTVKPELEAIFSDKLYFRSPLLDAAMAKVDGTQAVSGAWYATDAVMSFGALYESMYGGNEDYTVGKALYAAMKQGDANGFYESWSGTEQLAAAAVEMFGDEAEALRRAGGEYGAATGRPRRVGAFDIPASRYGVRMHGADCIALTKMDVLSYMDKIPVCAHYELNGEQTDDFPFPVLLQDAKPVVEYLPGWQCDISGARNWEDLPEAARSYVEYVEKAIGCHIGFVSVGAERESLIIR